MGALRLVGLNLHEVITCLTWICSPSAVQHYSICKQNQAGNVLTTVGPSILTYPYLGSELLGSSILANHAHISIVIAFHRLNLVFSVRQNWETVNNLVNQASLPLLLWKGFVPSSNFKNLNCADIPSCAHRPDPSETLFSFVLHPPTHSRSQWSDLGLSWLLQSRTSQFLGPF